MYDARSDVYDQNMVHVEQARDFINWAQLKPGHSLLDLACGTGLVTIAAKEAVGDSGHVVGVDISDGMLKIARQKAEDKRLSVRFINHDISTLR